jgi:hypothetical protein
MVCPGTVCDPVMGDDGHLYVPAGNLSRLMLDVYGISLAGGTAAAELVPVYRDEVVPRASILTPNQVPCCPVAVCQRAAHAGGRRDAASVSATDSGAAWQRGTRAWCSDGAAPRQHGAATRRMRARRIECASPGACSHVSRAHPRRMSGAHRAPQERMPRACICCTQMLYLVPVSAAHRVSDCSPEERMRCYACMHARAHAVSPGTSQAPPWLASPSGRGSSASAGPGTRRACRQRGPWASACAPASLPASPPPLCSTRPQQLSPPPMLLGLAASTSTGWRPVSPGAVRSHAGGGSRRRSGVCNHRLLLYGSRRGGRCNPPPPVADGGSRCTCRRGGLCLLRGLSHVPAARPYEAGL